VFCEECRENGFELIVAAVRQVMGAIKMARTNPLGQRKRAIERAVSPAGLRWIFRLGIGAVYDQSVNVL